MRDNGEHQAGANEHDSPSTTTSAQDDDVTLVHIKVDVHENRIAFWPETGEVLHSNQRSHGFESVATEVMPPQISLTQSPFSRNGPGYRLVISHVRTQ